MEATFERGRGITWYSPKLDPWETFDFRVYPTIARSEDGARKIMLRILVKDPPKGRPTSLQAGVGGEPWLVPIAPSDEIQSSDSGCRVTQTIFLQNQALFVQELARASQVDLTLAGYQRPVRYTLTAADLENFRRIASLWSAPTLPPVPAPTKEEKPTPRFDASEAAGITNPELIRSSQVKPRFPKHARGKNVLGRVTLEAVVREDGSVGDIKVVHGAGGDCGFEESAIEALSQWRYKPGMKDGRPVDVHFTVVVDFTYGDYRIAHDVP